MKIIFQFSQTFKGLRIYAGFFMEYFMILKTVFRSWHFKINIYARYSAFKFDIDQHFNSLFSHVLTSQLLKKSLKYKVKIDRCIPNIYIYVNLYWYFTVISRSSVLNRPLLQHTTSATNIRYEHKRMPKKRISNLLYSGFQAELYREKIILCSAKLFFCTHAVSEIDKLRKSEKTRRLRVL
jgi:hypothetical protein